jgi:hypothetical protein
MSHDYPSVQITRKPMTVTINPDLLDRLNTALQVSDFTERSTLYHMGYAQAQADFAHILNHHLNTS